jgi:hypothetical protein
MRQLIYHRTQSGSRALNLAGTGLPRRLLRLLAVVDNASPAAAIRARVADMDDSEVQGSLDDFEAIGLVESVTIDWLQELLRTSAYLPRPLERKV